MDNRFLNAIDINLIKKMEYIQELKTHNNFKQLKTVKWFAEIIKQNAGKKRQGKENYKRRQSPYFGV